MDGKRRVFLEAARACERKEREWARLNPARAAYKAGKISFKEYLRTCSKDAEYDDYGRDNDLGAYDD